MGSDVRRTKWEFLTATVEIEETIGGEEYGGWVWPCAAVLAAYLEETGACDGAVVLELGCGVGLVGLAAAAMGASRVVMTDSSDENDWRALCGGNILRNKAERKVEMADLTWGHPVDAPSPPPTLILASDCLFSEHLFDHFLYTLSHLLTTTPAKYALVTYHLRDNAHPVDFCFAKWGLKCTIVNDDPLGLLSKHLVGPEPPQGSDCVLTWKIELV